MGTGTHENETMEAVPGEIVDANTDVEVETDMEVMTEGVQFETDMEVMTEGVQVETDIEVMSVTAEDIQKNEGKKKENRETPGARPA